MIHLAGESIDGRWTKKKKERIMYSRAKGTQLLASSLTELNNPPEVFVSASAVGAYGSHPSEIATEDTPLQEIFRQVCQQWEDNARIVEDSGIRLVQPRLGVVLARNGGALSKMLPPFLAGGGGKVGSGKQWMSWVALDDVVSILYDMVMSTKWTGPVNVVAPNPVRNLEFTKTLGDVLSRPTFVPVPSFTCAIFGEMGETLLLNGRRVESSISEKGSYRFPDLHSALRFELGKAGDTVQ